MNSLSVSTVVALLLCFPTFAIAQTKRYTVWSSVVIARSGERTPAVWGDGTLPTILTSLGANQMYSVGSFFRNRYLSSPANVSTGMAADPAPIQGLSSDVIDHQQLYVAALDAEHTTASASAFFQAFYPPLESNRSVAAISDPSSMFANGSYLARPLAGYQYPMIHTINQLNQEWPGMAGQGACDAYVESTIDYAKTASFAAINESSFHIYKDVGPPLLEAVRTSEYWNYANAYEIYDYLNYRYVHNTSANALLASSTAINPANTVNFLDQIKWLADTKLYALNGNLSLENKYVRDTYNPWAEQGLTGSISTIGGNFLAGKVLSQLLANVVSGGNQFKLTVLFGDFRPMISFFALTSLPQHNSGFYGQPDFGSVMTFELFSMTDVNETEPVFPLTDDLWVRFYFRNGTDKSIGQLANNEFQGYPLFNLSPSSMDMSWQEFLQLMEGISMTYVGDWCSECGVKNGFCAPFSLAADIKAQAAALGHTKGPVSPVLAGVLGMLCTLVVTMSALFLVMYLGRVRFTRVPSQKVELGGFKGDRKLASDLDLVLPKHGGVVTTETVDTVTDGQSRDPSTHERHGSWELRQNPSMTQLSVPRGTTESPRMSFETVGGDALHYRPSVQAAEQV